MKKTKNTTSSSPKKNPSFGQIFMTFLILYLLVQYYTCHHTNQELAATLDLLQLPESEQRAITKTTTQQELCLAFFQTLEKHTPEFHPQLISLSPKTTESGALQRLKATTSLDLHSFTHLTPPQGQTSLTENKIKLFLLANIEQNPHKQYGIIKLQTQHKEIRQIPLIYDPYFDTRYILDPTREIQHIPEKHGTTHSTHGMQWQAYRKLFSGDQVQSIKVFSGNINTLLQERNNTLSRQLELFYQARSNDRITLECGSSKREKAAEYAHKYIPHIQLREIIYEVPSLLTFVQGGLESDWGCSYLALEGENRYGIKARLPRRDKRTQPVISQKDDHYNNKGELVPSDFIDFSELDSPGIESSFLQAALISNRRYALFHHFDSDPKIRAEKLKLAGYATSATYTQSLLNLMKNYSTILEKESKENEPIETK